MRTMTERFGIHMKTTAAESPFSNGICEKTVGLLKDSVRKMRNQIDLRTALSWAVVARNALDLKGGYAPN